MATERRTDPGEGMAMGGGSISVARPLPIDAALVGDVLLHLAATAWARSRAGRSAATARPRSTSTSSRSLFTGPESPKPQPAWTTTARLWDRDGSAAVTRPWSSRGLDRHVRADDPPRHAAQPLVGGAGSRMLEASPRPRSTSSPKSSSGTPRRRPGTPSSRSGEFTRPTYNCRGPATRARHHVSRTRRSIGPPAGSASVRRSPAPPSG